MNKIVNKFLLIGDKLMPEMPLKQPGFIYTACGPFAKNRERIENLCRQEMPTLFTEVSFIRLVFNTIWLMINQKI